MKRLSWHRSYLANSGSASYDTSTTDSKYPLFTACGLLTRQHHRRKKEESTQKRKKRNRRKNWNAKIEALSILALRALSWMETKLNSFLDVFSKKTYTVKIYV